jgi:hypothetical protein
VMEPVKSAGSDRCVFAPVEIYDGGTGLGPPRGRHAERYFAVKASFRFALRDHLALRVSLMIHHCLLGYSGEPCVSAVFGVCGFDFAPAHSKCIGSR